MLAGGIFCLVAGLLAALVVLAVLGTAIFRIQLRNPAGLALAGLGFALFAAGLQLLIQSLSKSDRAATFIGTVIILILSLVGGTFMPAEAYPIWLQRVAFLTPNGAAQQGLVDILAHARPLSAVGGLLATTWLWAVATLVAAVALERRRLQV